MDKNTQLTDEEMEDASHRWANAEPPWPGPVERTYARTVFKDGLRYARDNSYLSATAKAPAEVAPSPQAVTVEGKWISVDDRLPEMVATAREVWQSDYVLVFTDRPVDHQYRIVRAFLCKVGDKVPTWKSSGLGGAVTHWMPLPSAPASTNT